MAFKLRSKIILYITILVVLIMVSVTYFFVIKDISTQKEAIQQNISRIAQNIATMKLLDRQGWADYQAYISQLMTFNNDIVYIAIYDDRNTLRAQTLNPDLLDLESNYLTRSMQAEIVRRLEQGAVAAENKNDLQRERVNIQVGDRILGSVHIGFSVIEINQALENRIRLNIILAVIFILIFSGISIYISGRLTRPLESLNRAMSDINRGNLRSIKHTGSRDEIAQLTESFNSMVQGLQERAIIEGLARDLGATFQLEKLTAMISERLYQAIGAEKIRLYVKKKDGTGVCFKEISGEDENDVVFRMQEKEWQWLEGQEKGFMINKSPGGIRKTFLDELPAKFCLVVPMRVRGTLFGIVAFCIREEQFVSETKMNFASILSSQIAIALENALLYEDLTEQERMKRELEIAREMQQKLLPQTMPEIKGFEITGMCKPAMEVGGDYFDFFKLDTHSLGIVIADVSGKGTFASFYMAQVKGMMLQVTSLKHTPRTLLMDLNSRLRPSMEKHVFATMVYGILDYKNQEFTYARAGHNPVLKVNKSGLIESLEPPGIGLGLDKNTVFDKNIDEAKIKLEAGDLLFFYTDGITEARNSKNEIYGEKRLIDVIIANRGGSSEEIKLGCLNDLHNFLGEMSPQDDMTLIIIKAEG